MHKPWKYRPPSHPEDMELQLEEEDSWEDNWLSNSMAWLSDLAVPNWCNNVNHWTVKLVLYLWADCSCCLAFRFMGLGLLLGLAIGAGVVLTVV